MADWSELPRDLLQLISQKLNTELSLNRFRSICSSWRSSIPNYNNNLPLNLKLPHFSKSNNPKSIRHLSKHNLILIKPPKTSNQQPLRPWLIRIGRTFTGNFNFFHPILRHKLLPPFIDKIDINRFSVVEIGEVFYFHDTMLWNNWMSEVDFNKVVVSTCRLGQPQVVVTGDNSGVPTMIRCGDDSWMKIPNVARYAHDNCIFKGRHCVVERTGRTLMIERDLSVCLIAEAVFDGGDVKFLVESECELLLVDKFFRRDVNGDVRIDVFRLDEKEKKWVKLINLRDKVLFLGDRISFSASALDLGFASGSSIIMNVTWDSKINVFRFDGGKVSCLDDFSEYSKLFWPPPDWIRQPAAT